MFLFFRPAGRLRNVSPFFLAFTDANSVLTALFQLICIKNFLDVCSLTDSVMLVICLSAVGLSLKSLYRPSSC